MKKRILSHGLLMALATSATASMMLTGCTKYVAPEQYESTVVASYNGWDITLAEANFMAKEEQYSMEMLYSFYGLGDAEWDSDWEAGVSMQDHHKEQVMEQLLQTALLCSKAEEYGVQLSEEDKEKIEKSVDSALDSFDGPMLEHGSVSKEVLTKVITNNALANRVWESMSSDYDTTIEDEEEFRHKTADYILLRGIAETENPTGEEGTTGASETAEEKKEDLEKDLSKVMDEIEKEFHEGKSFADLVTEYTEKGYSITTSYVTIGKEDQATTYGPKVFELSKGEETRYDAGESGLYFFTCTDDDNQVAKEDAIQSEYSTRQKARFEEKYKELVASVEPYHVDERIWKGITFDVTLYLTPTPTPAPDVVVTPSTE